MDLWEIQLPRLRIRPRRPGCGRRDPHLLHGDRRRRAVWDWQRIWKIEQWCTATVAQSVFADNLASGASIAATLTVSAGSTLVVICSHDTFTQPSGATTIADTLNGSYPAHKENINDTVNVQRLIASVFTNSAAGSNTVTATFPGATQFRGIMVAEITGVPTSAAFDGSAAQVQAAPGTGTDAVTSGTASSIGAGSTNANQPAVVFGFSGNFAGNAAPAKGTGFSDTPTTTTGWAWGGPNPDLVRSEFKRITSTGAQTSTFTAGTAGTNGHSTIVINIDEATAAAVNFSWNEPASIKSRPPLPRWSPAGFVPPPLVVPGAGAESLSNTGQIHRPGRALREAPASQGGLPSVLASTSGVAVSQDAPAIRSGVRPVLANQDVQPPAVAVRPVTQEPQVARLATRSPVATQPFPVLPAATPGVGAFDQGPPAIRRLRQYRAENQIILPPTKAPTIFPLKPSGSGRYHVDQAGVPVFMAGDTVHAIVMQMSLANVGVYIAERLAQGFNTAFLQLISRESLALNTPFSFLGDLPFTTKIGGGAYTGSGSEQANFSTVNDAYFNYAKQIFDLLVAANMLIVAYWMPFGANGTSDNGWYADLNANSTGNCTAYGTYLGSGGGTFPGFASNQNVLWVSGSDYGSNTSPTPPSSTNENKALATMTAMQAAGAIQLQTGDWQAPTSATDETIFAPFMQTQAVYTYGGVFPTSTIVPGGLHTYEQARAAWNFTPTVATQGPHGSTTAPPAIPAWLKETVYEHTPFAGTGVPSELRKAHWWALLSGCIAGLIYGDENVWKFANGTWQPAMKDGSALDMARLNSFLPNLAWWKLIPSELSGMRRLVVTTNGSQSGTPDDYVAASQASDGSLMLCYVPTHSSGTQTFNVDLRSMAGNVRAAWWDPTSGTYNTTSGGATSGAFSLANSASAQTFTTPGTNAGGDNDWILLLDSPAPGVMMFYPESYVPPLPRPRLKFAYADPIPAISAASLTAWGYRPDAPPARPDRKAAIAQVDNLPGPTIWTPPAIQDLSRTPRIARQAEVLALPVLASALTAWGFDATTLIARVLARAWPDPGNPIAGPASQWGFDGGTSPAYRASVRAMFAAEQLGVVALLPWGYDQAAPGQRPRPADRRSQTPESLPTPIALVTLTPWGYEVIPQVRRPLVFGRGQGVESMPAVLTGAALTAWGYDQVAAVARATARPAGGPGFIVGPALAGPWGFDANGPRARAWPDRRLPAADVLLASLPPWGFDQATGGRQARTDQRIVLSDVLPSPIAAALTAWGFDVGQFLARATRSGTQPAGDVFAVLADFGGWDQAAPGTRLVRADGRPASDPQPSLITQRTGGFDAPRTASRRAPDWISTSSEPQPLVIPAPPPLAWGYAPETPRVQWRSIARIQSVSDQTYLLFIFVVLREALPFAGPTTGIILAED